MTALINQCLTVILEYIDLFILLARYSQLLVGPTPRYALKQGTQLIFKILEVYLRDHACQLEYSMIETYHRFIFSSAHYPFLLTKQTSLKLLPK